MSGRNMTGAGRELDDCKVTAGYAEQVAGEIHKAMEEAAGDTATAAKILGIETKQLRGLIHKNEELKARWANHHYRPKPPTDAVTIHRPALPVTTDEYQEAEAIRKEDSMVRVGLEKVGLSAAESDMAVALQQLHRRHFRSLIDLIGGGMAKQFLGILAQVESITKELEGKLEPAREMMLREHHARLVDLIPKYFDRANAAALNQAKIKAMTAAAKNGGAKGGPSKPGFSPLIAVQGQNVTITEKTQQGG